MYYRQVPFLVNDFGDVATISGIRYHSMISEFQPELKVISRDGGVTWSPRASDLRSLDYFI